MIGVGHTILRANLMGDTVPQRASSHQVIRGINASYFVCIPHDARLSIITLHPANVYILPPHAQRHEPTHHGIWIV